MILKQEKISDLFRQIMETHKHEHVDMIRAIIKTLTERQYQNRNIDFLVDLLYRERMRFVAKVVRMVLTSLKIRDAQAYIFDNDETRKIYDSTYLISSTKPANLDDVNYMYLKRSLLFIDDDIAICSNAFTNLVCFNKKMFGLLRTAYVFNATDESMIEACEQCSDIDQVITMYRYLTNRYLKPLITEDALWAK